MKFRAYLSNKNRYNYALNVFKCVKTCFGMISCVLNEIKSLFYLIYHIKIDIIYMKKYCIIYEGLLL